MMIKSLLRLSLKITKVFLNLDSPSTINEGLNKFTYVTLSDNQLSLTASNVTVALNLQDCLLKSGLFSTSNSPIQSQGNIQRAEISNVPSYPGVLFPNIDGSTCTQVNFSSTSPGNHSKTLRLMQYKQQAMQLIDDYLRLPQADENYVSSIRQEINENSNTLDSMDYIVRHIEILQELINKLSNSAKQNQYKV